MKSGGRTYLIETNIAGGAGEENSYGVRAIIDTATLMYPDMTIDMLQYECHRIMDEVLQDVYKYHLDRTISPLTTFNISVRYTDKVDGVLVTHNTPIYTTNIALHTGAILNALVQQCLFTVAHAPDVVGETANDEVSQVCKLVNGLNQFQ